VQTGSLCWLPVFSVQVSGLFWGYMEEPQTWLQFAWYAALLVGGFVGREVWVWFKDRDKYERQREQTERQHEHEEQRQITKVLQDNAVSQQHLANAVKGVSDYLEGMAHRDESIQNFLMVFRSDFSAAIERVNLQLTHLHKRHEAIGSELLAYAMGKTPERANDYTTLLRKFQEQTAELDRLKLEMEHTHQKPARRTSDREQERITRMLRNTGEQERESQ
jgi:hypothetical protein